MNEKDYDVLAESDGETPANEYLSAWASLLNTRDGRVVAAGLLRRGGIGLPIACETDRVLYNQAVGLFHDLFEANAAMAMRVFLEAATRRN